MHASSTASAARPRIVIIGAGAAGSILALHLAKHSNLDIVLVDRAGAFGRGLAYSAQSPWHCLNVPAVKMGAWHADDPFRFMHWLGAHEQKPAEQFAAGYVPRALFGAWLASEVAGLERCGQAHTISAEVVDVDAVFSHYRVYLGSGDVLIADAVALCQGNASERQLPHMPVHARVISSAWDFSVVRTIGADDSVSIVGTGASAVDLVLELLHRGHRGKITMVSPRALLPQEELLCSPHPDIAIPANGPLLRTLFSHVRDLAGSAFDHGFAWQSVMDALVRQADGIWARLSERERKQFMRHLKSYWMSFRHRADPAVLALLRKAERDGQLVRFKGRVERVAADDTQVSLHWHARGTSQPPISSQWFVSATGPQERVTHCTDRLTVNLLKRGLAVPGPDELGFAVSELGNLRSRADVQSNAFFALGLPTRGTFWEVTSVPAIRKRAAPLAQHIAALLHTRPCDTLQFQTEKVA